MQSYQYTGSDGKLYTATPSAATTTAQQQAVASNPAYSPISSTSGQTVYKTASGQYSTDPRVLGSPSVPVAPIAADGLTNPQNPINVPPKPGTPDYAGALSGATASLLGNGLMKDASGNIVFNPTTPTAVTTADTTGAQGRFDTLKSMLGLAPKKESVYATPEYQNANALVEQKQATLNSATAQLNNVLARQQADLLRVRGADSKNGVTEAVYGGQQAEINREAAIEALPISASIAAAQGDLQLAEKHLETLTKIKSDQLDNEYQYKALQYSAISDFVKGEQALQLKELEKTNDRKYQEGQDFIKKQAEVLSNAVTQKAPVSVINAINAIKPDQGLNALITTAGVYGGDKLAQDLKQAQIDKYRSEAIANNTVNSTEAKTSIDNDLSAILEGRNTMYNIRQTMGRTNTAAAYMQKLRDKITAVDPNFDFIASDAGGKSVSTSYVQRATAAINAVLPNIDNIIKLSDDVSRVGVKGVDAILQKTKAQFGDKAVSNFKQAQLLIADEIGVALGAGTVSDMKLQLGFDVTDPTVSPEVFASNMHLVKEFINNRKTALNSLRYASGVTGSNYAGTGTTTPVVNTDVQSILSKYGVKIP